MAYKDMNYCSYLAITLTLYVLQMIGAIVIEDISTVFEFISAFAITFVAFWFPGHYYLTAEKKCRGGDNKSKWHRFVAFSFYFVGAFNCFIGLFAAVLNIMGLSSGH